MARFRKTWNSSQPLRPLSSREETDTLRARPTSAFFRSFLVDPGSDLLFLSSLLAFSILPGFIQDPGPFPKATDDQPTAEYLNWSGFGFLASGDRTVPTHFRGPGDWSAVEANAAHPENQAATPWRLKVFVVRRLDRLKHLPDGTVYEEQCALETPEIDRVQRSLVQLQALVSLETHGKLRLVPDVSIEPDPVVAGEAPFDEVLSNYIYPRFNGGSFEADDRVYRGPYASVLCIHPVPDWTKESKVLNETPVTFLSAYGWPDYDSDGLYAIELNKIWRGQVELMARGSGVLGPNASSAPIEAVTGLVSPLPFVPNEDWPSVMAGPELDPKLIDARLRLPLAKDFPKPESDDLQDNPKLFSGHIREPTLS